MERTTHVDRLTVIAIGVVAYATMNICHEVLGHCTMAVIVGTKCNVISSTYIPLASELPAWKYKIIVVAGSTANWLAALVCFSLLRFRKPRSPSTRYFLWLAGCVNLFLPSTYVAVAPIIKFGDSYILIHDLPRQLLWRSGVALAGTAMCWFSFQLCRRELARLINASGRTARSIAWKLVLPAYVAGGIVTVVSALFSQLEAKWAQLEAAGGTFGLTAWLLLLPLALPQPVVHEPTPFALSRSRSWIVGGAVCALIFIGVLGYGISV